MIGIIIKVLTEKNSGMILVVVFKVSIYTSPVHQIVTPEHILTGFHKIKKN